MTEREAFLQWLKENEDDTTTRLVYADWLDDHGEHEEADRQRKWPAAREWLLRFCEESSSYEEVTYPEVIEFGRQVVSGEASSSDRTYVNNETMWSALRTHSQEFWNSWSTVTGIPLPPSLESKGFHHWECCAHDVYYWFGTPDSSDSEEEA